jgi:hypothetical protein
MKKLHTLLLLVSISLFTTLTHAEGWKAGPNFGVYLPSGIVEIDQVLKGFGAHLAYGLEEGELVGQFEFARGTGATLLGLLLSLRLPKPEGEFSPYVTLGPHIYYSRGSDTADGTPGTPVNKVSLGFNLGGGFFAQVKDNVYFDFLIRISGNPGATMYIGMGFDFLF